MQLKQIVLGVGERCGAAVRAHIAARKVPSTELLDSPRDHGYIDRVEDDHAAARTFGRLGWRAQRKRDRPGFELTPVVTIPKCQRKLQRLFVKGAHEIHVAGDRVDAPDGTEGHFSSSTHIQYC